MYSVVTAVHLHMNSYMPPLPVPPSLSFGCVVFLLTPRRLHLHHLHFRFHLNFKTLLHIFFLFIIILLCNPSPTPSQRVEDRTVTLSTSFLLIVFYSSHSRSAILCMPCCTPSLSAESCPHYFIMFRSPRLTIPYISPLTYCLPHPVMYPLHLATYCPQGPFVYLAPDHTHTSLSLQISWLFIAQPSESGFTIPINGNIVLTPNI